MDVTDRLPDLLPPDVLAAVDAQLLQRRLIPAIQVLREHLRCSLPDAVERVTERTEALKVIHPRFGEAEAEREKRETTPEGWRAQALERLDALERPPVAVEALWDGDTTGWFLQLNAILPGASSEHPRFTRVFLVAMRGMGGDFRVFTGTVPPWPECEMARELGQVARERWGIPFYFPSPEAPSDAPPCWWDSRTGP